MTSRADAWPRGLHCWPWHGHKPSPYLHAAIARLRSVARTYTGRDGKLAPRSKLPLVGVWIDRNGRAHGRVLGSGPRHGPDRPGLRTYCMMPWKLMPDALEPANPRGLTRRDFLHALHVRVDCLSCIRQIEEVLGLGPPNPLHAINFANAEQRIAEILEENHAS